jgi:nucleoside-diphosphate-sugar epimerase
MITGSASPAVLATEAELEEHLTEPSPALTDFVREIDSPLLVLGGGGKMGPSLAVLARRAAIAAKHPLKVVVVSRFTDSRIRDWLEARDVEAHTCDLLDASGVRRLPDSRNLIHLVGLKFGTSKNPAATWAVNTVVPAAVCERFPKARIVALSTGNVYPLRTVAEGGAQEDAALTPLGEYANAAVARERIFEYFSDRMKISVAILRLFYAVELRYGVLVDIARNVAHDTPIPLATGHVNFIWQRDANEMILRSLNLAESPPGIWNLCRPEVFGVREIATRFARLLGREPRFTGWESETALLGDSSRLCSRLGVPPTSLETMIRWIAHWIQSGGRDWERPTHFEVRDGQF